MAAQAAIFVLSLRDNQYKKIIGRTTVLPMILISIKSIILPLAF